MSLRVWFRRLRDRILNRVRGPRQDGAQVVVDHLVNRTDADAALVVDGSADEQVAQMLAAGWTLQERVDFVAGKRIRFMTPPGGSLTITTQKED